MPVRAGTTDEETLRNAARIIALPEVATYRVIAGAEVKSGFWEHLDVPALLDVLRSHASAANGGDLTQAEAMLMNQAAALQSLLARLAERGMSCTEVVPFETNMRIALRAQSQCRPTLETLAAIKNPASVAFVRQANIAHGPQQVNNGTAPPSRARENETTPSKLLEANGGERMDTGTASAAGAAHSQLEAVGTIDRS